MKRKTVVLWGAFCSLGFGVLIGLMAAKVVARSPVGYGAAAVLLLGAMILCIIGVRLDDAANRIHDDQDSFLARYNRAFRLFPASAFIMAGVSFTQIWQLWDHPDDKMRLGLAASASLLSLTITWTYALTLSARSDDPRFRRLIQDEFFQDNLAKARSDGFYATLAAITVCFLVGLVWPQWAIALLPLGAAFGVAYAGWRFNRRDKQALAAEEAP